tara:strand:+ start:268 stop:528 length:261 start_codon:yes stop_codon:yes gene_type:complete
MKKYFTLTDIATTSGLNKRTLWGRAEKFGLTKRYVSSSKSRMTRVFSEEERKMLNENFFEIKIQRIPDVIYVHTTWTILESKLNFE